MDQQAFAQLLGNYGEFIGAIAVVVTLFYLSVQVRLSRQATEANSALLEESRKLALANAYQARAEMLANQLIHLRDSPHIEQLDVANLDPTDLEAPAMKRRFAVHLRQFMNVCDNLHYQHEHGFLDENYYERQFTHMIRLAAPKWRMAGIEEPRDSFSAEVDRLLGEGNS